MRVYTTFLTQCLPWTSVRADLQTVQISIHNGHVQFTVRRIRALRRPSHSALHDISTPSRSVSHLIARNIIFV